MSKICTSQEQSRKLVELGIDVNSSDCSWILSPRDGHYILSLTTPLDDDIPAWSLSALLDLMPIINNNTYTMRGTLDKGAVISHEKITCVMCQEKTPIDAAFEMIVWLLKNNKI